MGQEPNEDKSLASNANSNTNGDNVDLDGLKPSDLESRFEQHVPVHEWYVLWLMFNFQ